MAKQILTDGDDGIKMIIKGKKPRSKGTVKTPKTDPREPVHVIYGGADLFKPDTAAKLGRIAVATLEKYFPDAASLYKAVGSPQSILTKDFEKVYVRVAKKLAAEAVEDLRIDFEDGYGFRPDKEEDADAENAAKRLADALSAGSTPPFIGFRVKSFAKETRKRAERTLNIFLNSLLKATGGKLPANFVVTLPKVTSAAEIKHLVKLLAKIESKHGIDRGSVGLEFIVETPSAIFDKNGKNPLSSFYHAADGRCRSVHFGAYDYTASVGIAASHQHIRHPACNFARQVMLATLSPFGVRLSDSVTTVIPVAAHKAEKLTAAQKRENLASISLGLSEHFANVTASLADGFYQSWDLHPNHLIARYAAVYSFFIGGMEKQGSRLKGFIDKATKANLIGTTFDDAASAQGLLNYFNRALNCKALTENEVTMATGLTAKEINLGSFEKIMSSRRA